MDEHNLTLAQIEAFRGHLLAEERAPGTVEKYQRDLRAFLRWLDGRALPSIDNLYALQGLLDISVEQLLCGSYIPPNKRLLLRSITYQRIASAYAAANALLPEFYGHSL